MSKGLFVKSDFISHSGLPLEWKIDCDALSDNDIDCLAWIIAMKIVPEGFNVSHGVPKGGNRIAEALRRYSSNCKDGFDALIIDDVLTTGYSMEREKINVYKDYKWVEKIIGVVLFARGPCPHWVRPVFKLGFREN